MPAGGSDAGRGAVDDAHGRDDPGGGGLRRGARAVGAAVEHDDDLVRVGRDAALRAERAEAAVDALRLVARRDDDDGPEDGHGSGAPRSMRSRPAS